MEEVTPSLLDRLHGGTIDQAVVALPVLTASHRYTRRESIRLIELKDEPILLLKEGHCFRESTITACRQAHVRPNVVFESGQFATILAMVSAGGVSRRCRRWLRSR